MGGEGQTRGREKFIGGVEPNASPPAGNASRSRYVARPAGTEAPARDKRAAHRQTVRPGFGLDGAKSPPGNINKATVGLALRRRRHRRGAGLQCGPPAIRQRHASAQAMHRARLAGYCPARPLACLESPRLRVGCVSQRAVCSAEGPVAVFGYDPYRRAVGDEAATQPDQVGRCDFPFPVSVWVYV